MLLLELQQVDAGAERAVAIVWVDASGDLLELVYALTGAVAASAVDRMDGYQRAWTCALVAVASVRMAFVV